MVSVISTFEVQLNTTETVQLSKLLLQWNHCKLADVLWSNLSQPHYVRQLSAMWMEKSMQIVWVELACLPVATVVRRVWSLDKMHRLQQNWPLYVFRRKLISINLVKSGKIFLLINIMMFWKSDNSNIANHKWLQSTFAV